MKIFDKNGNVMANADPARGHFFADRAFVAHHAAVEAVREQGHYETVREYPNGGKDVVWVVDVPGTPARAAYDEYEDVLRFVEYTPAELAEREINELKKKLFETDYAIIKIAEGSATADEYAETIEKRRAWRLRINDLEHIAGEAVRE